MRFCAGSYDKCNGDFDFGLKLNRLTLVSSSIDELIAFFDINIRVADVFRAHAPVLFVSNVSMLQLVVMLGRLWIGGLLGLIGLTHFLVWATGRFSLRA